MMKGTLSSCPMLKSIPLSKSTCMSFFSVFYAETERKDVEKTQSVRFLYFCLPLSPETRRNVLKLVSMNTVKPLVGGTLLQRSAFFTVGSQLDIIKYVEVYAFW